MQRTNRRMVAAVLAAGLALGASACGVTANTSGSGQAVSAGSFEGARGAATLARSAEATAKVKTMKVAMTMSMSGAPGGMGVGYTAAGEIDNGSHAAHLTMTFDGELGSMMGAGIEEIVTPKAVYVKSSMLSGLGGRAEKPWIKVPVPAKASKRLGDASADPTAMLGYLEQAGETTTVGTEEVRGTSTTHVRTTIDFDRLVKDKAAKANPRTKKAIDALGGLELGKVPVDAWVDGQGRLRKMSMTYGFAGLAGSLGDLGGAKGKKAADELGKLTTTISIELYDFDRPVTITEPPADQVQTMDGITDLLGGMGGLGGLGGMPGAGGKHGN